MTASHLNGGEEENGNLAMIRPILRCIEDNSRATHKLIRNLFWITMAAVTAFSLVAWWQFKEIKSNTARVDHIQKAVGLDSPNNQSLPNSDK